VRTEEEEEKKEVVYMVVEIKEALKEEADMVEAAAADMAEEDTVVDMMVEFQEGETKEVAVVEENMAVNVVEGLKEEENKEVRKVEAGTVEEELAVELEAVD
jgi:hypothetical protein